MLRISPILLALLLLPACGGKVITETAAKPATPAPKPPTSVPAWLGNASRNFYGTGPWSDAPLQVVWEFKTNWISGRLHKDPWGGSSWPGQPSVDEKYVYFGSADGRLYCLDAKDGSLVWSYKTEDSLKATPTIAGDRLIASGLDHYIYCIDARTGTLIWKYKTGFEVDCSAAVIDNRVYFGGEDGYFYSLNLGDGKTVWKARIGADSDSTPAVYEGKVYTAAENGVVYCFRQINGELVWKYQAIGGTGKEKSGFWASPIVANERVYIGSSNGYLYCFGANTGEVMWRYRAKAAIWGTSPLVDGRLVFGDKAGWLHTISAEDGQSI